MHACMNTRCNNCIGVSVDHEEDIIRPQIANDFSTAKQLFCNTQKTDKQMQLIYRAVKDNILFSGMAYRGVMKVISMMWKIEVPPQTFIVRQGEVGDNMYVVEKGKLHVLKQTHDGTNMKKVDSIRKKECFGHLALMYHTPRTATIVSTAKTVLVNNFARLVDPQFILSLKSITYESAHGYNIFAVGSGQVHISEGTSKCHCPQNERVRKFLSQSTSAHTVVKNGTLQNCGGEKFRYFNRDWRVLMCCVQVLTGHYNTLLVICRYFMLLAGVSRH